MSVDPFRLPKAMKPIHDEVVAPTDALCADRLGPEYRDLARRMAAALGRKRPSPLVSGQPRTWAAAVIYTLGRINFLADPATDPTMSTADLAKRFGVGQSTIAAKAKAVQQALNPNRMSTEWTLPSRLGENPLFWIAQVNGLMVDLRDMPREVQEIAFTKGLIPFIPDEGD